MRDTNKHLWIPVILVAFMAVIVLLTTTRVARADGPIYVDRDAPGPTHDGLSWATAYTNVQDGLEAAVPDDEIWVAEGVYVPTYQTDAGDGRTATFVLTNTVSLYGGFGGYGTGETLRSQRDWEAHVAVLSGDLDGNDITDPNGVVTDTANITGTNAYHVVTGSGTDDTAVLDGFTVTGGKADGSYPHHEGGGMYNNWDSDPTLTNVTFSGNTAGDYGGGMYNCGNPTLTNVIFGGNTASDGGGMVNRWGSNPTLANVTFSGNAAGRNGGGMYTNGSNPTLANVTFSGNHANSDGGGMVNYYGNPTLTNVTFSGNHANSPDGRMVNSRGGGMYNSDSNPTLTNVTFSGNTADDYGGGMYNNNSTPTLSNCILWGNDAFSGPQIAGSVAVSYSLVEGGHVGTGNLDADPQFMDADGLDGIVGTLDDNLSLLPASPAVDAGDNTAVPTDTLDLDGDGVFAEPLPFDLDGVPRFVDIDLRPDVGNGTSPIVDMGAYEADPGDLWIAKGVLPATPHAPSDPITYTIAFANDAATIAAGVVITDIVPAEVTGLDVISSGVVITQVPGVTYAWTVQDLAPGAGGLITLTGVISPGLTGALNFVNTAIITTTAVDTDTANNRSSVQTHISGIIYVDADAPGMGTGLSWTDAFANLQDALALAEPGDEIWMAEGVYTPTNVSGREATFRLESGVSLYGGFGGYGIGEALRTERDWKTHVTVLSGDLDGNDTTDPDGVVIDTANITGTNAYHVVIGSDTDNTAVLDGFTVTGGQADGRSPHDQGGGMVNYYGNPTLTNVTFSGNDADYSGYLGSGHGGGMYNYHGNPTLTKVTFSGNHADEGGGGMYNYYGNPTLSNVTFSGNHADEGGGGGMHNFYSDPRLNNVTFSGNHADGEDGSGGGMYNYDSDPRLSNVTFSGNHAKYSGGMYNYGGDPTLSSVTFSGNHADSCSGGMRNSIGNPTLTNVTFSGNSAGHSGGGMYNYSGDPTLTNVTFSGNRAGWNGGGMLNEWYSDPTLTNVTFSGNTAGDDGGGMYNWSTDLTLTNVTFSGNRAGWNGGGMCNDRSNPTLSNCILWGNTAFSDSQIAQIAISATINYSLVEGGYSGTGNLDADPQFVDADGPDDIVGTLDDNLRLLPTSPAVDAGDNTAVPTDTLDLDSDSIFTEPLPFDLDGNPRFIGIRFRPGIGNGTPPIVDLGAYEVVHGLNVVKTVDSLIGVPLGGVVTYTLVISNSGDDVVSGVVVTDPMPMGLTFGQWLDRGSAQLPPPVTWGPFDVGAHTAYTLSFTANVTENIGFAGQVIVNTAHFTAAGNVSGVSNYITFFIESAIHLPAVLRQYL